MRPHMRIPPHSRGDVARANQRAALAHAETPGLCAVTGSEPFSPELGVAPDAVSISLRGTFLLSCVSGMGSLGGQGAVHIRPTRGQFGVRRTIEGKLGMIFVARRTGSLAAAAAVIVAAIVVATRPAAAAAPPASPIGDNQQVYAIVVSPAYVTTGLVVAAAGTLSSTNKQLSLFVSQDGGATWGRAAGAGWDGGAPAIGIGPSGREVLVAGTGKGVQRSDDLGQTWTRIGDAGTPSIMPSFGGDGAVAVGDGAHDYIVRGGASSAVAGSSGTLQDFAFAFMAGASSHSGGWAPVLLSAVDPHTNLSVVERCTAQLACSGPATTLAGTSAYSGPPTLLPSTTFASDGTVFARTQMAVFKSTDGGATFAPLAVSPTTAGTTYPAMGLAPGYSEHGAVRTAYVTELQGATQEHSPNTQGGVYRTTDGGATWAHLGDGTQLTGGAMALAVAPDGRVFASYLGLASTSIHGGLLCSIDGGGTWLGTCPAMGTARRAHSAVSMAPVPTAVSNAGGAAGAVKGLQGGATNAGPSAGAGAQPVQPAAANPMRGGVNWRFPLVLAVVAVLLSVSSLGVGRLRRRKAATATRSTSG